MSDEVVTAAPVTLWLTDRTRSKTGLGRCQRKRYLSTAFGPTGYGITTRSESLPLATGKSVHAGSDALCQILLKHDRLPTAEETRAIATAEVAAYQKLCDQKGYLSIRKGPLTEETIAEQSALITGLLWVLRLDFLPWLHEHFRLLSIEEERIKFLSCSCGAGPLPPAAHIARGCTGIGLMLRRDLLARRRVGGTLAYFETKTTGWGGDAWTEQWETDPQLALGTLDTIEQFGAEVTELYIVGLHKGPRQKDRYETVDPNTPQRKKQQSPLCYGYCRPSNPPLTTDDWLPSYQWADANGELRRASKQHRRRGVWELPASDWPTWTAYHAQEPEMSPAEFWVRMLPPSLREKTCFLIGPMNRQDAQLQSLLTGMRADEEHWQQVLWELYEAQATGPLHSGWQTEVFQAALDRLVPCSWQCRPFGREHQCEFVPICHRQEGWSDPLLTKHYVPRRPHHAPELAQAVARGLLVEQTEDEADEEDR